MNVSSLIELKANPKIPDLAPGDTVKVSIKVVEGGKERIQLFQGVVIKIQRGGINASFTVRRIAYGVGVERTFPLYSPRVEKVEIVRHGKVRRARLYYLRGRSGKAARIKERRVDQEKIRARAQVQEEEPELAQAQEELVQDETEVTQVQEEVAQDEPETVKAQEEPAQVEEEVTQTKDELPPDEPEKVEAQEEPEVTQPQEELTQDKPEATEAQEEPEASQAQEEPAQEEPEATQTQEEEKPAE